jgi:hypothetical protein
MKFVLLFATIFSFIASSQLQENDYLHTLPLGYKLTDSNNEEGKRCEQDIDGDSRKDLIVQLFDSNDEGIIVIYLSSTFEKDKSYQWFNWIWSGNSLNLDCDKTIQLSGGIESMGVFQELELTYSNTQKKVVVSSYNDNLGEVSFKIYSGAIK